jgi:hypothetical protein
MWRNMSRDSLMKVPICCTHWDPQITWQTIPYFTSSKWFTSVFLVRDVTASRILCCSCGRSFGSFGTKIHPSHSYTSRSHLGVSPVTWVVRNTQRHFLRCQATSIAETVLSKLCCLSKNVSKSTAFLGCEIRSTFLKTWHKPVSQ